MIFKVERIAMFIMHFCLEVGFRWCSRWNMSHRYWYSCITKLYIMFLSGRNLQSTTDACQSESHLKSVFLLQRGCWKEPKRKMSKEMLFLRSLEHHLPRFLLLPLTLIHFPWSFKLARVIHLKSKMEVQWLEVFASWGWLKKISWQLVLCHW